MPAVDVKEQASDYCTTAAAGHRVFFSAMPAHSLRPRLRVLYGELIAFGPGKAKLLEAIESTGTLAEAASQLGMSYMRAWKLVQTMNACFKEPLVQTLRGGTGRGHAELTATGRAVLDLYHRMEEESVRAAGEAWREMCGHLAD
jgi:molybdate transport system regulatory protein